jgi:hypothetical protein
MNHNRDSGKNIIGRSIEFWNYFYPYLVNYFEIFNKYKVIDFVKAANKIDLQPIRIEADELTYNLHIILRFNIERKIFNENLKVKEIPDLWNDLFYNYFGYKLDNYSDGFFTRYSLGRKLIWIFPYLHPWEYNSCSNLLSFKKTIKSKRINPKWTI